MYIVDDPTLALIARFVGETHDVNVSDADFLFGQVAAIKRYVRQFPVAERQSRALQWIETYAQALSEHYGQARWRTACSNMHGLHLTPKCQSDLTALPG